MEGWEVRLKGFPGELCDPEVEEEKADGSTTQPTRLIPAKQVNQVNYLFLIR